MTRAEIEARLARHRESFAKRSVDALVQDHAPDGTFESPAVRKAVGREAIADIYRYWLTAVPDMTFEWREPIIDGNRAAIFWHFAGTVEGPFFGEARPGTRLEMDGAAEYIFSEQGIQSASHIFDFSGALVKSGALKVKPS